MDGDIIKNYAALVEKRVPLTSDLLTLQHSVAIWFSQARKGPLPTNLVELEALLEKRRALALAGSRIHYAARQRLEDGLPRLTKD